MALPYVAVALLVLATVYSAIVSFREAPASAQATWFFPRGTKRFTRVVASVVTAVVLSGFAVWIGLGARHSIRPSSRFLLPDGYTGWVRIEFEVHDSPPLEMANGRYILRIPSDGKLTTSSPEQYGWANDEYYFYSNSGIRRLPDSGTANLIWGKLNGEAGGLSGTRKYEEFFVGTRQQFAEQISRTP